MKILLAEDYKRIAESLAEAITEHNYIVVGLDSCIITLGKEDSTTSVFVGTVMF